MNEIRCGLGNCYLSDCTLPENALTLHELGELIRRAGIQAGFVSQSEYKVRVENTKSVKKIDWVWLSKESRKPIAAFEIEGPGVYPDSIKSDVLKFDRCGAMINIIALFQIDHNHSLKPMPPHGKTPTDWVRENAGDFELDVYIDEELFMENGIEKIQRLAVEKENDQHKANKTN